MKPTSVALLVVIATAGACQKSKKKAEADDTTTGTLNIELGVSAIAAQGAYLTAQTSANAAAAAPGNLTMNPVLNLQGVAPADFGALDLTSTGDYRTPVLPTYSIASGAPDELVLYVTKMALSKSVTPEAPFSAKSHHPALFPSQYQASVEALVGQEFSSIDALAGAIMQAGVPGEILQSIFGSRMSELGANWQPSGSAVLFEDANGKPISIASGTVDLSGLGVTSQNGVASFPVSEGEFDTISMTFLTKASVKGCVKALYKCLRANGVTPACTASTPEADVPGNQGLVGTDSKMLTYCTQASKSPYTGAGTQNSDFLDKTPESMDFPLSMDQGGYWREAGSNLTASYSLPSAVTIRAGEPSPRITLLVDMNRMLRYYNRGRVDQGPNPGMPMDRSYFFTSIFPNNTYAFAGAPGKIYGFEMQSNACLISTTNTSQNAPTPQGAFNSGTGKCTDGSDPQGKVPFWMTIITDGNGAPVYALTSPDDDNDLTITKGNVKDYTICGDEPSWVAAETSDPQKATIRYALCENDIKGPEGAFKHFPADLDSLTVTPPSQPLGQGTISGVQIWSKQVDPNAGNAESVYEGPVYVTRRL